MKKVILAADRGDGLIGIWWYTDDRQVIGLSEPADSGRADDRYVQYSKGNHMSNWRKVVTEFIPTGAEELIAKGFKSLYRGRVLYDTMTACYVVTCSADLIHNIPFRDAITGYFQLSECNRRFETLDHYRYKNELTGNPAVDAFYFDN